MLFETLDGRPFGIRPVLPIAATQPPGEPTRLDSFRDADRRRGARCGSAIADGDPELAEALDRWELSLFQNEPFRGEQLRATFTALFGETWPMRVAVLLAEDATTREELHGELVALASGDEANAVTLDTARKALVAVLRSRDRVELVHDLDRQLLGLPRRAPLRGAVV